MTAHASIHQFPFSETTDLYLENVYLNVDKLSLEIEVEHLRLQLNYYKSLAKEYKELYFAKR